MLSQIIHTLQEEGLAKTIQKALFRLTPLAFRRTFKPSYVAKTSRSPELIVSLTSHPKRIKIANLAIETLLNQTLKPNRLILWLNENEFPRREKDLPIQLLRLRKYGLSIEWTDRNIRSFKKIMPSLAKYPDAVIIAVDDDCYYAENCVELLYANYLKNPKAISAHRALKLARENDRWATVMHGQAWYTEPTALNLFENIGGVLYPPHSLYPDVTNEELYLKLAPTNDDLWLWSMAVLNDTSINIVEGNLSNVDVVPDSQGDWSLWKGNMETTGERLWWRAFYDIQTAYPALKSKLLVEAGKRDTSLPTISQIDGSPLDPENSYDWEPKND